MADDLRRGRVVGRKALSPRVTELALEVAGEPPFVWRAGQHVAIRPDATPDEAYAYSIASAPDKRRPGVLELAVGNEQGAELLANAEVGTGLGVEGPFGSFTWRDAPGALLVGAGTGLAPLRAITQAALAMRSEAPLLLLPGSRTESDLLWEGELQALAVEHLRLRYEPVLSRPDAGWTGRRGYVQDHLAVAVEGLPSAGDVYLCGSGRMVDDCRRVLGELGVSAERIQSESYS